MEKPNFSTKIAIALEKELPQWKALNVTAFLASAIASKFPETLGVDFTDASAVVYLGIFRQPVLIFETQGDQNLIAVGAVSEADQDLVGIIVYGEVEKVNAALKGLSLHK